VDQEKQSQSSCGVDILQRRIRWYHGLFIAMAVPVLVLPSIGYFALMIAAFSIVLWILNVIEGFFQCTGYAELAATYPYAPGIPGANQEVWKKRSHFIGGFGAWGYWFAWNPVISINALLGGWYLQSILFPGQTDLAPILSIAFFIFMGFILLATSYFGVVAGSYTQLAIVILSLGPLLGISASAYITGQFRLENITNWWLPEGWNWFSLEAWLIFLGLMALAEWSSCAWECAATYSAEYKDPKRDVPLALMAAGGLCLFTYPFVQAACIGSLGADILSEENYVNPLTPIAIHSFGQIGGLISIVMMLSALILISNTALLGSSRALYSLARNYQVPVQLSKLNKHNSPFRSAVVTYLFNFTLLLVGISYGGALPIWILSASAVGYLFINGLVNIAFVLSRKDIPYDDPRRTWKAPRFWVYIAAFWGIVNLTVYQVGLAYVMGEALGVVLGYLVMLLFIGLYYWGRHQMKKSGVKLDDLKPIEM